jgi:hypothetical protein
MTPRDSTATEAKQAVHDFRAIHTITPITDPDGMHEEVCSWDMIHVYRVKGGYRHDISEVRVLIERAPIPQPGDYL